MKSFAGHGAPLSSAAQLHKPLAAGEHPTHAPHALNDLVGLARGLKHRGHHLGILCVCIRVCVCVSLLVRDEVLKRVSVRALRSCVRVSASRARHRWA